MGDRKLYQTDTELEQIDLRLPNNRARQAVPITVVTGRAVLLRQLKTEGMRERTIQDYIRWFDRFTAFAGKIYVNDLGPGDIYGWLESMNVKDSTKLLRLKSLKAVLTRLYDRGYFQERFWKPIKIRVDSPTKQGTLPEDLEILFNILDLTDYFQLRDAVAVLLMYTTGLRSATVSQLREIHVDLDKQLLTLSGDIMKNRQTLLLPLDKQTTNLMKSLIAENKKIRAHTKQQNDFIFISRTGRSIYKTGNSTVLQKRLIAFSKKYGIKNINPHSLRRAYARNLYDKGANVALISKALGHKSLDVTTRYLDISNEELAYSLREFL